MRRFTAFLLALGIIVLLVWNSADFFRHPYYEYWDSAANSLSVLRAKHFAQLYGAYSRYGFCHPGPAFFYVDALGEWLFYDVWHVVPSPFQGQVLGNLCLMTGFYVAALSVFAHRLPARRHWLFLCVALVLGILHFTMMGNIRSYDVLRGPTTFMSVWPVHSLVLPFLCLLTAGASVGAGCGRDLPLLVLAGGFLVEHVALPLFIGPTAVVAYVGLIVCCARRQRAEVGSGETPPVRWWLAAWRGHPCAHLLAGGILFLFLLPMLIDLCWGRQSNFAAILHQLHEQAGERKKLVRSIAYFLQFGAYAAYKVGELDFGHYSLSGFLAYLRAHTAFYAFWLLVLVLVLQAPCVYFWSLARRRTETVADVDADRRRRFLAWAALVAVLNLLLSLYWGTRQDGWMFYYNSWFNFAIYYFAALVAMAVLCGARLRHSAAAGSSEGMETRGRTFPVARLLGVGAVILTAVLFADRLRVHDDESEVARAMHLRIQRAIADSDRRDPAACKVVFVPDEFWAVATAVGLELARAGDPFVVFGRWRVLFGAEYDWRYLKAKSLREDGFRPWYIVPPDTARRGVPKDAPVFPLRPVIAAGIPTPNLELTPPNLQFSASRTAEIHFVRDGNAADFCLSGWGAFDDPSGTWSEQPWAALAFHPPAVDGTQVEVSVDGVPFVVPVRGLTRQRARLYFNGAAIGTEQQLSAAGTMSFTIPAATWNAAAAKPDAQASLAFELPDAVLPGTLDPVHLSGDPRTLGIFFQKVRLRVSGYLSIERAMAAANANHPSVCKVLLAPAGYRAEAAAVGWQLAGAGEPFVVRERPGQDTFDAAHDWRSLTAKSLRDGLSPWYIAPAGTSRPGVATDSPSFALSNGVRLTLTPPTLELSAAGSTAEIRFGRNGNAEGFVLAGWGALDDPSGSWSEQPWAALAFHPQTVAGTGVEVLLGGDPFLLPSHGLNRQRIRLYFNGTIIGPEQQFSAPGVLRFVIPAAVWNAAAAKPDAQASLAFEFPDAVIPASLDPGGDPRDLAVFFTTVRLQVVP